MPGSKVASFIHRHFPGSKIYRTSPLTGGISAIMTLVEFTLPDGQLRKVVLRQPGSSSYAADAMLMDREFNTLQFAHAHGLAVPEPYLLDSSCSLYPAPVMVMEYIESKMDFAPVDRFTSLCQMADQLAAIHRVDLNGWDSRYAVQPLEFEEEYGSVLFCSDPVLHEADLRRTLDTVWPIPQRNASALLHGDYWPGNLLWRGGKLAAVVDWEDAAVGDPLVDLAGCRMETCWIFGHEFSEQYTTEYLKLNPLNTALLPYFDLLAALRLLRWAAPDFPAAAAFFHPYGRNDITGESIKTDLGNFVSQALARIG